MSKKHGGEDIRKKHINPYLMNGFSHSYQLGEFILIFRGVGSFFFFFFSFFDEISLCKQNSPRCDAAFCGVTSGAMLFCLCPTKGTPGLYELKLCRNSALTIIYNVFDFFFFQNSNFTSLNISVVKI